MSAEKFEVKNFETLRYFLPQVRERVVTKQSIGIADKADHVVDALGVALRPVALRKQRRLVTTLQVAALRARAVDIHPLPVEEAERATEGDVYRPVASVLTEMRGAAPVVAAIGLPGFVLNFRTVKPRIDSRGIGRVRPADRP